MRWLLDTDICIEVLRSREPARSRVRAVSPDELAVSAMSVAELRFGALNSREPERALSLVQAFLAAPVEILAFDQVGAEHHARVRLELRSEPIGERDLVLAATALACDMVVVTHNRRHFDRVRGLAVEDWSGTGAA